MRAKYFSDTDTLLFRFRRPGKRVQYQYRCRVSYNLHWSRNRETLRGERRIDGVFPLLCADPDIPPKQVVQAWKFQPRIEKRFSQFKSFHQTHLALLSLIDISEDRFWNKT